MLNLLNTRFGSQTFHREVAPGVEITQEGLCLVATMVAGKVYVQPSAGTANEVFVGFSQSRFAPITRSVKFVTVTVPATSPYTVDLGHVPISGQIVVAGLTVVGGAPNSGEVKADTTSTLTFNSAQAGVSYNVHYAYVPSVVEAIARQGNAPVGGLPSSGVGVIGVIAVGDIATDCYDVAADFTTSSLPALPAIKTGANGFVTIGGSGCAIPGTLLKAPGVGDAFLQVSLHVK